MKAERYEVKSNLETGLGRADIIFSKRDGSKTIMFEIKTGNPEQNSAPVTSTLVDGRYLR